MSEGTLVESKNSCAPAFNIPEHKAIFQGCIPAHMNIAFARELSDFIVDQFDSKEGDSQALLAFGKQLRSFVENTERFKRGESRVRQRRVRRNTDESPVTAGA